MALKLLKSVSSFPELWHLPFNVDGQKCIKNSIKF